MKEVLKLALEMVQNKMYAHAEMYLKEALAQPEQEPVAFFKTADLKAAWEAGYSAGRIAPLENKSTKVGTIGHIGDGKTTLTAAITPLLTEYKIGQEVKVTHLNHGGAVYNNKREIINANKQPHKTICIGRIVEIKQEGENGAVIVKCEGDDKFLPRFHFYPQDNAPDQIVEVLGQPKPRDIEQEFIDAWNAGKVRRVSDGAKPWVGLTDEEIMEMLNYGKYGHVPQYVRNFVDAIEAKLKEKNT